MTGRANAQRRNMQMDMGMMMVMPMSKMRMEKCSEVLPADASCFRDGR